MADVQTDVVRGAVAHAESGQRDLVTPSLTPVHLRIDSGCVESHFDIELEHEEPSGSVRHATTPEQLSRGLIPGKYILHVRRPGWTSSQTNFVVPSESNEPIQLVAHVEPLLSIDVYALDADTGEPVTSCAVIAEAMVELDGVQAYSISDEAVLLSAAGNYCLPIEDTRSIKARAMLRAEGYDDYLTEWSFRQSNRFLLEPALLQPLRGARIVIAGTIVDSSGVAISSALVRLLASDEVVMRMARVDERWEVRTSHDEGVGNGTLEQKTHERRLLADQTASLRDGTFSLRSLAGRTIKVLVVASGFQAWTSDAIPLQESRNELLRVVLYRGAEVNGRVHTPVDPAAQPVQVQVQIVGGALGLAREVRIDPESGTGEFRMDGLAPGSYDLLLTGRRPSLDRIGPGEARQALLRERLEVGDGRVWVDLHYNTGLTGGGLRGSLSPPDAIVPNSLVVHVFVESDPEPLRTDWIRPNGTFEMLDLAPRRYGVLVVGVASGGTPVLAAFDEAEVLDGHVTSTRFEGASALRVTGTLESDRKRSFVGIGCVEGTPLMQSAFYSSVSVLTDRDGRFAVFGIPPGTYRLRTRDLLYECTISLKGSSDVTEARLVRTTR